MATFPFGCVRVLFPPTNHHTVILKLEKEEQAMRKRKPFRANHSRKRKPEFREFQTRTDYGRFDNFNPALAKNI
jgi:hypothetical protein